MRIAKCTATTTGELCISAPLTDGMSNSHMKPEEYMAFLNRLQDLAHEARHDFLDGTGTLMDRLEALEVTVTEFIAAINSEKGGRKQHSE